MSVALVVIFNQDFSCNIPKLEKIYEKRFRHRFYLAPDHWSRLYNQYTSGWVPQRLVLALDRNFNVVRHVIGKENPFGLTSAQRKKYGDQFCRVYGHQFFFYHFLHQTASRLLDLETHWYLIVGDDAILNPEIDEATFESFVGAKPENDAVLCQPVIGSDRWVAEIAGSVNDARRKLSNAFGSVPTFSRDRYHIQPDVGAEENVDALVACADFLALRRGLFEELMPIWERCFKERIYVEMAVPNAVLNRAQSPIMTNKFIWQRAGSFADCKAVYQKMLSEPGTVFCHPVKLSTLEMHEMPEWSAAIKV